MGIRVKGKGQTQKNKSIKKTVDVNKIRISKRLKNIPLSFIYNAGQVDSEVRYYIKADGCGIYFNSGEVVFTFVQKNISKEKLKLTTSICIKFIGANPDVKIESEEKCEGIVNYFKGKDTSKWYTDIPVYKKIIYRELWAGIDLVFYSVNGELKYDFILKPGASVEDIQLTYKGFNEIIQDEEGNLTIKNQFGMLLDDKPIAYQIIKGKKSSVKSKFIKRNQQNNKNTFGFEIEDNYDSNHTLIIDPQIVYSAFSGGSQWDEGNDITVDSLGNIYVTGTTASVDFKAENSHNGFGDAFVTKFSPEFSILNSSYLGGSKWDVGNGIAVDSSGNIYVTGYTDSLNFPADIGYKKDMSEDRNAFVTKLAPDLTILSSRYLGGNGSDWGKDIAVDDLGNVYITGATESTDFPVIKGFNKKLKGVRDAFVIKLNSDLSITYSSYLGGRGMEEGEGIAVDKFSNIYITGFTTSLDFPSNNDFHKYLRGDRNAFVTKINHDFSKIHSSFLGGSRWDVGNDITVDNLGNVYVTGITQSTDFPVVNGFNKELRGDKSAFVTIFYPDLSIHYSSYLGGSGVDQGNSITVDNLGNIYITGFTTSSDFPVQNAFNKSLSGDRAAFVTKLNSDLSISFSTYLGGSHSDWGNAVAVDNLGYVYVTGHTKSPDFPIYNRLNISYNNDDAFAAKIWTGEALISISNVTISAFEVKGKTIKEN